MVESKFTHWLYRDSFVVLLCLEENDYESQLAKKTNITYSHVCKILSNLRNKGLIEFPKREKYSKVGGVKSRIHLTEKGAKVKERFIEIYRLVNI